MSDGDPMSLSKRHSDTTEEPMSKSRAKRIAIQRGARKERVPWGDDNPCPDCRTGLCHACGEEKPDALLAPHMGVVLCGPCFYATFDPPPNGSRGSRS